MKDFRSQRLSRKILIFQAMLVLSVILAAVLGVWLNSTGWRLLWLLLVSGIALYVTHSYTQSHFFDPIHSILVSINRVTQGDLDERVFLRSAGDPEFVELSEAINGMTEHYALLVEEANRHRNHLNAILSSLVDALIVVDKELKITLVNPAAVHLLGISPDSQGRYLLESVRNYDLVQLFQRVLTEQATAQQEIQLFSPQHSILRAIVSPIRSQKTGKVLGVVAILHDITELKRLEKMRTDFVANVSHELRTPLTAVKGFVETLLDGAWEDKEAARRFLGIVSVETDRMVSLVKDLLELSRLEGTERAGTQVPVDIVELVEEIGESYESRAAEAELQFYLEIDGQPPAVLGDATLLRQAITNLLDNAIKYTDPGGRVWLTLTSSGEHVHVAVRDTGIGIPAKHLSRIFERFYRVDKGRCRKRGGTGLGLAIVKHIVEKHQGKIDVESEYGEGSCFTITLPAFVDVEDLTAAASN
ncbi:MAG: phosphate regulon sensor histidine kinase PhoR [Firmicutes bacterium]|jgi:two-component system phosphate regulon sensor histidine kinase PhoR|nr:phosphate regulon sensor histidine kinase PhoR [Bacillota bacterium]